MGTMAKVMFYTKNEETNKFKVKRSFTMLYDGLYGVGPELTKILDFDFDSCEDFNKCVNNTIERFEHYIKCENKKVNNESESYVDYCYKVYIDKTVKVSLSSYGNPILTKATLGELKMKLNGNFSSINNDLKKTFIKVASKELNDIEGFNLFMNVGIDEIISYLYDDEEPMDSFDFEQNILYYFSCDNDEQRNQVEKAAEEIYPHYTK